MRIAAVGRSDTQGPLRPTTGPTANTAERPVPDQLPAIRAHRFFAAVTSLSCQGADRSHPTATDSSGFKADVQTKQRASLRDRPLLAILVSPRTAAFQNHIGLGGLEETLRNLSAQFRFYQVNDASLGADRRTALVGLWTDALVLQMLPDQKVAIEGGKSPDLSRLAPHVPDHVVLLLGPDDLFPYRIEFRRSTDPGRSEVARCP